MSPASIRIRARVPLAHFELDVDIESDARSLGIFGASGAGKTTLLELLAGWREPASGRLSIGAMTLFDDRERTDVPIEARGAGYVTQDALLLPHWSVRRNVEAGATRGGTCAADHALVERTLGILGIEHLLERSTEQLSGGERQRVALARALASRPRFLLLDEPLGSLDLALRRRILPYLIRVRDEFALPTVFVSHDATEIQALCDEVVVLDAGRVVARGLPADVLRESRGDERAFENVLAGRVRELSARTARLELDGGGTVEVPGRGLAVGEHAWFALGSEDVLVALDAPSRISARNVLHARVERVDELGDGIVQVEARLTHGAVAERGARIAARITQSSASELDLRAGREVFLVFKTHSCRVLSAAPSDV